MTILDSRAAYVKCSFVTSPVAPQMEEPPICKNGQDGVAESSATAPVWTPSQAADKWGAIQDQRWACYNWKVGF